MPGRGGASGRRELGPLHLQRHDPLGVTQHRGRIGGPGHLHHSDHLLRVGDLTACAALILKAEREHDDRAKRAAWEGANDIRPEPPKQASPAPGVSARRRAMPKGDAK
jgi:hypothetical protein